MPDNDFVKGVKVETKQSQYGEYIKGYIDVENIFNNPIKNNKYINFMMFKSKAGNWYMVNAKQKDTQQNNQQNNIVQFVDEDDLPF